MLRRISLLSVSLGLCSVLATSAMVAAERQTVKIPQIPLTQPSTKPTAEVDPYAPPSWVRAATRPTKSTTTKPVARPLPKVDHVIIFSIDGCRPDVLLRCDAPTIHQLFRGGTYTFWAKTTPNSITLPSHTSMVTGVSPRKHGIEWNRDLPLSRQMYPYAPTIFYQVHRIGMTTGMAAGKSKFDFLAVEGTLDYESLPTKSTGNDMEVAVAAGKMIAAGQPNLLFVHLPGVDNAGHKYGWGTKEQAKAITEADAAVAYVLQAMKSASLEDRTVIIISADHGGAGKNHGPDDARCRHIPWIASGPGVKKGLDLTTDETLEVRTEDTFATACWLLGVPLDPKIDGKPVTAAFDVPKDKKPAELLRDIPAQ